LIILLRNPIERAFSHWNMEYHRKVETLPFFEAIKNEHYRARDTSPLQHRVYSYIDRGFYVEQLRRLWKYFPREQTLVLKSEKLKLEPQPTIHKICEFLQVNLRFDIQQRNIHVGNYVSRMTLQERAFLGSIFDNEITELEKILGWDCSAWREKRDHA